MLESAHHGESTIDAAFQFEASIIPSDRLVSATSLIKVHWLSRLYTTKTMQLRMSAHWHCTNVQQIHIVVARHGVVVVKLLWIWITMCQNCMQAPSWDSVTRSGQCSTMVSNSGDLYCLHTLQTSQLAVKRLCQPSVVGVSCWAQLVNSRCLDLLS